MLMLFNFFIQFNNCFKAVQPFITLSLNEQQFNRKIYMKQLLVQTSYIRRRNFSLLYNCLLLNDKSDVENTSEQINIGH